MNHDSWLIKHWILNSQKHETNKAIHGIGQFFFFGNRYNLTGSEEIWAKSYQNYIGNFIRTGDPNGSI